MSLRSHYTSRFVFAVDSVNLSQFLELVKIEVDTVVLGEFRYYVVCQSCTKSQLISDWMEEENEGLSLERQVR